MFASKLRPVSLTSGDTIFGLFSMIGIGTGLGLELSTMGIAASASCFRWTKYSKTPPPIMNKQSKNMTIAMIIGLDSSVIFYVDYLRMKVKLLLASIGWTIISEVSDEWLVTSVIIVACLVIVIAAVEHFVVVIVVVKIWPDAIGIE